MARQSHLIAKHGRLVNTALADSNIPGWNRAEFRVFSEGNLAEIHREFGSDDAVFSERYFRRDWLEVFPDDAVADKCTELFYDHLRDAQRREIDNFVGRNTKRARKAYQGWRRVFQTECISILAVAQESSVL